MLWKRNLADQLRTLNNENSLSLKKYYRIHIITKDDLKTFKVPLPSNFNLSAHEKCLFIALFLRNLLVIVGAQSVTLDFHSNFEAELTKFLYYKHFNNFSDDYRVDEINSAWSTSGKFTINLMPVKRRFSFENHREIKKNKIAHECLCINIGQTELKICYMLRNGKSFPLASYSKFDNSYSLPGDHIHSLEDFLNSLHFRIDDYFNSCGIEFKNITNVLFSIGSMVMNDKLVPYPNGVTKKLSSSQIRSFSQLLKELPNKLGMRMADVYIVNDGELASYGHLSDNSKCNNRLALRFGTSLCAGYIGNDIIGEFGWLQTEVINRSISYAKPIVNLKDNKTILRNKLSTTALKSYCDSHGIKFSNKIWNSVLMSNNYSSPSTQKLLYMLNQVGLDLADAIFITQHFLKIDDVLIGGSIIDGQVSEVIIKKAKSRFKELSNGNELVILNYNDTHSAKSMSFSGCFQYLFRVN